MAPSPVGKTRIIGAECCTDGPKGGERVRTRELNFTVGSSGSQWLSQATLTVKAFHMGHLAGF